MNNKTKQRYLSEVLMEVLTYTSMQILILAIVLAIGCCELKAKEPVEMIHVKIADEEFTKSDYLINLEKTPAESLKTVERGITVVGKAYNDADLELLSQLMYAEEGVLLTKYDKEPEKVERVFKLAGSVAIRRMEHNYKGAKNLKEVLYTEGQYALQTVQRVHEGQDVPNIVYVWAEELLTEGPIGPKGLIYQAEFEQGEVYDKLYNQVFGIEPKYN